MKTTLSASLTSILYAVSVTAGDIEPAQRGLVQIKSVYSVEKTAERLAVSLEAKGLTLFTQIDHAAGAESVGQSLRPTRLLVFGNPNVGTPLMQCDRTVAIDLPQKALIWEDNTGQVWVGYNDPRYLRTRHNLQGCEPILQKVDNALRTLATSAAQPNP